MTDGVVDATVRAIISQSLQRQLKRPDDSVVDRVSRSFRELQERRRGFEPLNMNLAAAEHYMYARFLAGVSGDPLVRMAPTLYGTKKRVYFALGIQDRMATTHNPVLPPNDAIERWGTLGAEEGLTDYVKSNGRPATNYGNAIATLITEARRYN